MITWAIQTVQASGWIFEPTDKDGGFCLVRTTDLQHLILEKIATSGQYSEISVHALDFRRSRDTFNSLGAKLLAASSSDPSIKKDIAFMRREATAAVNKNFISKLNFTVKTHKAPGAVSLRFIHSCSGHPFGGFGRAFSRRVLNRIGSCKHIAKKH